MAPTLRQLRLMAFKSVRDAVVDLGPLTLIAGRNGSGKSNIIDGLAVLAALTSGNSLRDALDGGRDGPTVRGGSSGCAPLGTTAFSIGCTVDWDGVDLHLDIEVRTEPNVQIESERLWSLRSSGPRRGDPRDYLRSDAANPESGDIVARWDNRRRGVNPPVTMRADQLLTSQVSTRIPATSAAGRTVHEAAAAVLEAIRGIFILDPVPHQMREYVPEKDSHLRRSADNLSASLTRIVRDPGVSGTLLEMTRALSEAQVSNLSTISSDLGDVMVAIEERIGGLTQPVPARLMSDGTLRFLAMAAALLDEGVSGTSDGGGRLLVVEEIENGLHPSQASLLVDRLKQAAQSRGVRTLATTHSPALLDALEGADHEFVVVAARDNDGWSTVTRLTDFPDYFELLGRSSLGDTAVQDRLRPGSSDARQVEQVLAEIF